MDTNILQGKSELGEECGQVKPCHKRKMVYQLQKTRNRQQNTAQINTKVNGKYEEPRNKMVLFMIKISNQNDMEEDGGSTLL
jgi:hypothetical protein